MPRKPKADQEGRFAKGRKGRNQWPGPSIWGSGPGAETALDRWLAGRCDGTCNGACERYFRLARMRAMYAKRRR